MLQLDLNNISWPVWLVLSFFCLSFIIQMVYYFYYYIAILNLKKKTMKGEVPFITKTPGVSVIIAAKNEALNLEANLPAILNQNYPDFEVIVVNDGSSDETESILSQFEKQYKNLYHTYVPEEAQVMSPKKLALTVGIKAAKHDMLLFTDADCQPVSENWIESMARNFTKETDFVLGYGAYKKEEGFLSQLISYDTFFIALQYLGFAYRGKPYMGVGRNMAYSKKMFFDMKGFASMLHIQSGDDDLFVNKAANKKNTRIEISPDSVTTSSISQSFRDWFIQKERHLSTANFYRGESKALIGLEVTSRGLFYCLFIAILFLTSLPLILIATGLFVARYTVQIIVINLSAKQFKERYFHYHLLLFDILLPLISLFGMMNNKVSKKTKYQWK